MSRLLPAALTRGDIATYVEALIFVYTVLIVANVILSWVQQFRPIPYNLTLRAAGRTRTKRTKARCSASSRRPRTRT